MTEWGRASERGGGGAHHDALALDLPRRGQSTETKHAESGSARERACACAGVIQSAGMAVAVYVISWRECRD